MKHQMARQIIPKVILTVLLAGCASAPPAPVRVEVPVMVPCVGEMPLRPSYEFDNLPATATDGQIILVLAWDWTRGRKYEGELAAIVIGCGSFAGDAAR